MKKTILFLMFLAITFSSFSQNRQIRLSKQNKVKNLETSKQLIPVDLKFSGNESLCEINSSIEKQLKSQGVIMNKKNQEKLAVYTYNIANPNIGIELPDFDPDKPAGKVVITIELEIDKDGKRKYRLKICFGKNCE